MEIRNDEVRISETEASGGKKLGVMRYVLGVSLVLAIALLSLVWMGGAVLN